MDPRDEERGKYEVECGLARQIARAEPDSDEAVLEGGSEGLEGVKVVCRPHHCRARELRWMAQQGNAKYHVSIDMFDVGLLLTNPKLHRQHFVLK